MLAVNPHRTKLSHDHAQIERALAESPLGPGLASSPSAVARKLNSELALVWQEFTERLARVPVIAAIESETITREGYLCLLRNLRQQVMDGGRWLSQIAASMSQPLFDVRSSLILHAAEEHRDYLLIEKNYVAAGGALEEITGAPKNVGSEAFSSYMFHRANQADPLDLYGAVFILEGLGSARAGRWAEQVKRATGLPEEAVTFLSYHGKNDDAHYEKLRRVLASPHITEPVARAIVRTARTVARLYLLQLEELDHV